jgi:hypothetical protein
VDRLSEALCLRTKPHQALNRLAGGGDAQTALALQRALEIPARPWAGQGISPVLEGAARHSGIVLLHGDRRPAVAGAADQGMGTVGCAGAVGALPVFQQVASRPQ